MTVEYDLVIIGQNRIAWVAAFAAIQWKARVALIASEIPAQAQPDVSCQILAQVGQAIKQIEDTALWGYIKQPEVNLDWNSIATRIKQTLALVQAQHSLSALAALGIDVIQASGQFCRKPLGYALPDRVITARRYLLVPEWQPSVPEIPGLNQLKYVTLEQVAQISQQPDNLLILGGSLEAVEIAQSFNRLGSQVTLVVESEQLATGFEPEALHLIQTILETEGVQIFTQAPVTQARQIDHQPWIQSGHLAHTADTLLLAQGWQPQIDRLSLEAIGVKWNAQGIQTNRKLQTSHPQVYVCQQIEEIPVVISNALFWAIHQVDRRARVKVLNTTPPLVQIGLTGLEARQGYGSSIQIVQQDWKTTLKQPIQGGVSGFAKWVLRRSGEIVGASLMGPNVPDLVPLISLAIRHHLKLADLFDLPYPTGSSAELIQQSGLAWQEQQFKQASNRQNWLKFFFRWRRG